LDADGAWWVSGPGLAPLEAAVMEVMWNAREPITGQTCRDRLDYKIHCAEQPAYTTVMGILASLRSKRLLTRVAAADRDGPTRGPGRAYEPRVSREEHLAAVIRAALACAPDPAAVLALAVRRRARPG
jgi:predicted transcriptional regulator